MIKVHTAEIFLKELNLFNQIIFLDRLRFDPIFGDFTSFLQNEMFHQNKNLQFEKFIKTKLSRVHALDSQDHTSSMVSYPNFAL